MTKYTIKDVTQDLKSLMSLTKIYTADNEGFWYDKGLEERVKYARDADSDPREIIIFQDPVPKGKFLFFNPYSEGFSRKSPAVQLFWRLTRVAFNVNLTTVMFHVVNEILNHKNELVTDSNHTLPHEVLRMSAGNVDKKTTFYDIVDEKLIDEFNTLIKRLNSECVHTPYLHAQMTTVVKIRALTDPTWDEEFGKDIRKKSLIGFKLLLMNVLGISSPEDLNNFTVKYNPDIKSAAPLYATLSVYLKLYSAFNDTIEAAYSAFGESAADQVIDLGELEGIIERSSAAYAIAKHMVEPVIPKKDAVDTTSANTTGLNLNPTTSNVHSPYGRFTKPNQVVPVQPSMYMPPQPQTGTQYGRFSTQVVAPNNPVGFGVQPNGFAPRPAPQGYYAHQPQQQGVFGQQPNMFAGNSGFSTPQAMTFGQAMNAQAPSNFGSPGTRRNYFGR